VGERERKREKMSDALGKGSKSALPTVGTTYVKYTAKKKKNGSIK
jgi:hypothetical protein